jgi:hypothetical protein
LCAKEATHHKRPQKRTARLAPSAAAPCLLAFGLVLLSTSVSSAADVRSRNWVVSAPTAAIAQKVANAAEQARERIAVELTGQSLQDWSAPCPVTVTVTTNGAGGATSFGFDRGRPPSMKMQLQGPVEKLVDSVVPHEVTHTVLADLFRAPVPRWVDEGLAVCAESEAERRRHDQSCRDLLNSGRRKIPLKRLLALSEYPEDIQALYAQGYSLTSFLIGIGGPRRVVRLVGEARHGDWDRALSAVYGQDGLTDVDTLERAWLQSLRDTRGRPALLGLSAAAAVASGEQEARPAPSIEPGAGPSDQSEILTLLRAIRSDQTQQRSEISDLRSRVEKLESGRFSSGPDTRPLPWNERPLNPSCPPGRP